MFGVLRSELDNKLHFIFIFLKCNASIIWHKCYVVFATINFERRLNYIYVYLFGEAGA